MKFRLYLIIYNTWVVIISFHTKFSKKFRHFSSTKLAAGMIVLALLLVPAIVKLSSQPAREDELRKKPSSNTTQNTSPPTVIDGTTIPTGETTVVTQQPAPTTSPVVSSCLTTAGSLPVDLWVWQSAVATDAAQSNALFTFAKANNVKTVYLESEKLINTDQTSLGTFIKNAKSNCVDVVLLYGAADWAFTRNHDYAVSLAQKSVAFANQAAVSPVGIQYDVEPYNLEEYKADINSGANQYLDMLEKIKSATNGSKLYFAKTMPLGFEYQPVTRNGITMSLSHATIDRVDHIALMDYRDTASRIISDASDELTYAAMKGKKVVIGVETSCTTGEVETITFCEEGKSYMFTELQKVKDAYSSNGAYVGLAVHDYEAFKILK